MSIPNFLGFIHLKTYLLSILIKCLSNQVVMMSTGSSKVSAYIQYPISNIQLLIHLWDCHWSSYHINISEDECSTWQYMRRTDTRRPIGLSITRISAVLHTTYILIYLYDVASLCPNIWRSLVIINTYKLPHGVNNDYEFAYSAVVSFK